ncbi:MAG: DUF835 domain-containing protein [Candidatus Bathyarchaeota archaeon]|nr:DUF835 domain-containing protein [Candidatus Bathyarchaeota archaeon]
MSVLNANNILVENYDENIKKHSFEFGNCYLITGKIQRAYEIFSDLISGRYEGVCITRKFPPLVKQLYELDLPSIFLLTRDKIEQVKTIYSLIDISILINNFLNTTNNGVVLLDGFEYLTANHGFNSFLKFLQLTKNRFERFKGILIAPIIKEAFDLKEIKLIEREMAIVLIT